MVSRREMVARYVVLIILALIILFPIWWLIRISLTPPGLWLKYPPSLLPPNATIENFLIVLGLKTKGLAYYSWTGTWNLVDEYLTSLVVAGASTALACIVGLFTGYSISRFRMGGKILPIFFLVPLMFPPMAVIIPVLVLYTFTHLLDTYYGLILIYAGFTMPFSIWMMKSFIDEVPRAYDEAGILNGLSRFEILFKIIVPLISSGIVATFLFVYILNFSEYILALVLSVKKVSTLPVGLNFLTSGPFANLYGPQSAIGLLGTIPMLIFGFFIRKHLVRGFTFGAVKLR